MLNRKKNKIRQLEVEIDKRTGDLRRLLVVINKVVRSQSVQPRDLHNELADIRTDMQLKYRIFNISDPV